MLGGEFLIYYKTHPLTNKKANIKTHKYGVAILMYGLRYLTFYITFRRIAYVSKPWQAVAQRLSSLPV